MRFSAILLLCAFALVGCASTAAETSDNNREDGRSPLPTAEPWQLAAQAITLENIQQIELLGRLDPPDIASTIMDYALSPDTTRLATINNTELSLWDLLTGERVYTTSRQEMTQLFYSPDKIELYGLTPMGDVLVLDAETGGVLNSFQAHPSYSGTAAFDPNQGWLAVGGNDGVFKVWDPLERTSLATFAAHTLGITALAFSPDGERLVTAAFDGFVRVWDWREQTLIWEQSFGDVDVLRLTFGINGQDIAGGTADEVIVWAAADGRERYRFPLAQEGAAQLVQIAPDGRTLIAGSRSAGVFLWSLEDGRLISGLSDVEGDSIRAHFDPSSRLLLTTAVGQEVSIWNVSAASSAGIPRAQLPVGADEILLSDWTIDGRLMLFFDTRGYVYVWGIAESSP